MLGLLQRYTKWLHTSWPAGTVEKLPRVNEDGSTSVKGIYVVGDLTGIPLLKFSADTGARAVKTILADSDFQTAKNKADSDILDLVIIGAGVSGMAAALEAREAGLNYDLLEATEPFSTIANFPKGKPIYTYPREMTPAGQIQFRSEVKEPLLDDLKADTIDKGIEPRQARAEKITRKGKVIEVTVAGEEPLLARRVIIAIGRSGNFRKLGVPGEELDKVYNRLHDPKDFADKDVLIVGGGDSALESAIALAQCGAKVTLSYRKKEFSRPKPDNIERINALQADPSADVDVETPTSERVTTAAGAFMGDARKPGSIDLKMASKPLKIEDSTVTIQNSEGNEETIPNDVVFSMIGRQAPLDFFRQSRVSIRGETVGIEWLWIILFFIAMWWVYDWKGDGFIAKQFPVLNEASVFPNNAPELVAGLGDWFKEKVSDRSTIIGTLAVSMKGRSFYYTFAYTLAILIFGIARIKRRKTPYVKLQTSVLFLIQCIPLFLLPELILPWMGYNGFFDAGFLRTLADNMFELYLSEADYLAGNWPDWGHPRAYWRAYGLILAWPLMVYNVFTDAPMLWWLVISVIQTFVIIPALIYFYGKGAYCGWICSCGGLAETMGDTQRHKMFHGAKWNRLNMLGQGVLLIAFILLVIRILGWIFPDTWMASSFSLWLDGKNSAGELVNPISYKWVVDVFMGGVLGVGLYFKYSGRVWCRFACPLAALMHIYSRFSRFRIVVDKKKCISCNQCTSVCHQGIDIMNFANKGLHMNDPECVRCSACVQSCPTGVLQFGQVNKKTGEVIKLDKLAASPVLMTENK